MLSCNFVVACILSRVRVLPQIETKKMKNGFAMMMCSDEYLGVCLRHVMFMPRFIYTVFLL